MEVSITAGYGERGLGIPGSDSALTSVLGTEFTWGTGSAAGASIGLGANSGAASAFCTVLSVEAGWGAASVGAGRALLVTGDGRSAFPICYVSQVKCKQEIIVMNNNE